jgi:tetratricopeptide (TPR) repeat protein
VAALSHPTTSLVDAAHLRSAERAGLIRVGGDARIVFAHPLYAAAVYTAAPIDKRRAVHARLSKLALQEDERVRHLSLSVQPPDETVARSLVQGATSARARGAWHVAADLLERAAVFTPANDPDGAGRRTLAAAEHLVHAGDRRRAGTLLERLLTSSAAAAVRADALRLLGEIRYNDESFSEARRCLEEALTHGPPPHSIAEIELDLAYTASQLSDNEAAVLHVQRAVDAAPVDDRCLGAQALAFRAMSHYLTGRGIDWATIARAMELEDPNGVVPLHRTPSGVHALLLLFGGQLDEARPRLRAVCARAIDRGDESDVAFFLCWLVWLEIQAGNLDQAQAHADRAELTATLTEAKSMRAFARALQALISAHRGEVDRSRRESSEARALAQQTTYALALRCVVIAECMCELSVDAFPEAWGAVSGLVEYAESHPIGEPVGHAYLPDALEALIELGQLDRAEHLLARFETSAEQLDRTWALATAARCRGLLLAARGDLVPASGRSRLEQS